MAERVTSRAPGGQMYEIPSEARRDQRLNELRERARKAKREDREVVVVQGLGFVGSAMAAVTAMATNPSGTPSFEVIGVDLPIPSAYWKVEKMREGRPPISSADERFAEYIELAVHERRNLTAVADPRAYGLADVVVVDVQVDVRVAEPGKDQTIEAELQPLKSALTDLGRHLCPDTLVLIESTVPPGTTEKVAAPLLRQELETRGVDPAAVDIAYSFERVMPGPRYVESIERYWRAYAGMDDEAAQRAEAFLSLVVDTHSFPLHRLPDPRSCELAKVLENSYRATNIAFIDEWSRAAEKAGIDLFEVIDSIAVREGTHDNIRRPGFGVGGYCLPKDGYLAQWGLDELLDVDTELGMTLDGVRINREMPEHTFELLREALDGLEGRKVLVAGVSYRGDIADTRNSPSADLCDRIREAGGKVFAHDPLVKEWVERPKVSLVDFDEGVAMADAVVLAVGHRAYRDLEPGRLTAGAVEVVLDTQNLLDDEDAEELDRLGALPVGVGKGHWVRWYRGTE